MARTLLYCGSMACTTTSTFRTSYNVLIRLRPSITACFAGMVVWCYDRSTQKLARLCCCRPHRMHAPLASLGIYTARPLGTYGERESSWSIRAHAHIHWPLGDPTWAAHSRPAGAEARSTLCSGWHVYLPAADGWSSIVWCDGWDDTPVSMHGGREGLHHYRGWTVRLLHLHIISHPASLLSRSNTASPSQYLLH
jgi:hypothetical protein